MQVNNPNEVGNALCEAAPFFEYPQASFTASVAETPAGIIGPGPLALAIGSIILHPLNTLALSGTAYVTINVFKRTAGGAGVLIGTTTTQTAQASSAAWTAYTPVSLTLQTGAGSFVSPNDTITMQIVVTGAPAAQTFTIGGFIKPN